MSGINLIEIDYVLANKKADELDALADKLDTMSGEEMEEIFSNIQSAWKGDNANAFLSKGEQLQGKISASGSQLRNIAGIIRQIAKNLKEADQQASAVANEK